MEIYPPVSGCSLPDLPTTVYGHASFVTTGPNPKIVSCGGSVHGHLSRTCTAFDPENQSWDDMGQLPKARIGQAAISMENIGTYQIGGGGDSSNKRTSDFMAAGSTEWVAGPEIPVDMTGHCSVVISQFSFLIFFGQDILEYQVDIANPTRSDGWQESTKWPQLQTNSNARQGCTKLGNYIVIAGGASSGSKLGVTEVLDLSTKTTVIAGEMNSPRYGHFLATIRRNGQQMLFALGGYDSPVSIDSVEQYFPSNSTWTLAPALMGGRHAFSAVVIPKEVVCTTTTT